MFAKVFQVTDERFDELVAEAIASIPKELASEIENVAIFIETLPPPDKSKTVMSGQPQTANTVSKTLERARGSLRSAFLDLIVADAVDRDTDNQACARTLDGGRLYDAPIL